MNISRLLDWAKYFGKGQLGENYEKFKWVGQVFQPISIVLYVILGVVGAAGAIYAIYLGIQLARAEDQSKRDDAKKHLITVLIAIAVTVALILFFNEIMPMIVFSFAKPSENAVDPDKTTSAINTIATAFKML